MTERPMGVQPLILSTLKKRSGFGFSIHASSTGSGVAVKSVTAGGAAEAACVREGNRLCAGSGQDLLGATVAEATAVLKAAGNDITLLHATPETVAWLEGQNHPISEATTLIEIVKHHSEEEEATPPSYPVPPPTVVIAAPEEDDDGPIPDRPICAHLVKLPDFKGFGFSMETIASGGSFLKNVESGGPAGKCEITDGWRLLAVNGQDVSKKPVAEAAPIIRVAGEPLRLLLASPAATVWLEKHGKELKEDDEIVKQVKMEAPVPEAPEPPAALAPLDWTDLAPPICATVCKWDNTLGFGLGRVVNGSGIVVTKVDVGGPAEKAEIRPEWVLVAVGDTELSERPEMKEHQPMTAFDLAVTLIKADGEETRLLLFHPHTADVLRERDINLFSERTRARETASGPYEGEKPTGKIRTPPAMEARVSADTQQDAQVSIVTKPIGGGSYGFGFQRGPNGGVTIKNVDPGTPADECSMVVKQRVVAVNGSLVLALGVKEAADLVKAGGSSVTLLLATDAEQGHDHLLEQVPHLPTFRNGPAEAAPTAAPAAHIPAQQLEVKDWPDNLEAPRICHLVQWPQLFKGYGFNLHADKSRSGQFIGTVDDNSPADLAGLKSHWRIVCVNGISVEKEVHTQVVQRIKQAGDTVRLLVASHETEDWCTANSVNIRESMEECEVKQLFCPGVPPRHIVEALTAGASPPPPAESRPDTPPPSSPPQHKVSEVATQKDPAYRVANGKQMENRLYRYEADFQTPLGLETSTQPPPEKFAFSPNDAGRLSGNTDLIYRDPSLPHRSPIESYREPAIKAAAKTYNDLADTYVDPTTESRSSPVTRDISPETYRAPAETSRSHVDLHSPGRGVIRRSTPSSREEHLPSVREDKMKENVSPPVAASAPPPAATLEFGSSAAIRANLKKNREMKNKRHSDNVAFSKKVQDVENL